MKSNQQNRRKRHLMIIPEVIFNTFTKVTWNICYHLLTINKKAYNSDILESSSIFADPEHWEMK